MKVDTQNLHNTMVETLKDTIDNAIAQNDACQTTTRQASHQNTEVSSFHHPKHVVDPSQTFTLLALTKWVADMILKSIGSFRIHD